MDDKTFMNNRILLVEDEESLAVGLEYNFIEEGYTVNWAKDGREALKLFETKKFDLVILDIMIPYVDGFEVAERVRQTDPRIPILILTARTATGDRIKGLESGADDYLAKPFHLKELLLRVKGMLRRKAWYQKASSEQPVYKFGDNEINFENFNCKCSDKEFTLTAQEAMVIKYLIENKEKIVSRKELLENVWHMNPDIETRTVDNFIVRLRKYFEPDPSNPVYIKSVRSAGYVFENKPL